MLIIQHRVNTVEELLKVPRSRGIEVDIRSEGDRLIASHDPFKAGEDFEELLKHYQHQCIILNVKADGMEPALQRLMQKYGVRNYFFLDAAIPTMMKLIKTREHRFAVRYSEVEPIEFVRGFAGKVDWVWVDCFTRYPLDQAVYQELHKQFKLCMVSPELVGRPLELSLYQEYAEQMPIDAVCTDCCEQWETSAGASS